MKVAVILGVVLLVAVTLAVEDQGQQHHVSDRDRLQKLHRENKDNPAFRGGKVISTWDGTGISQQEWHNGEAEQPGSRGSTESPKREDGKTTWKILSGLWDRGTEARRFLPRLPHHLNSRPGHRGRGHHGVGHHRRSGRPHRYGGRGPRVSQSLHAKLHNQLTTRPISVVV